MLAYGPFRPDAAGPDSGYAAIAENVLPQAAPGGGIGYGPMAGLVTATGAAALNGAPRGGITVQKQDGSYVVFFASADKIQFMTTAYAWTDIDTGRTVTAGADVSFCYFGKYVINTDTTSGVKAYDVEGGGANTAVAGLSAAQVFSCNNVVFYLNTDATGRRFVSTAIGDYTNLTTQGADGKTLEDGGILVGGRDLKNGSAVLFQENASRFIKFGGGAGLYTVSKIADGRGAVSDRAICAFDGMVFYVSTDGLWKFTEAGGNEPIGAEKVNRYIASMVSSSDYENIQVAVDPLQKLVWFRLSATLLLGYDWQLNECVTAAVATTALTRIAIPGVSIDSVTSAIDDNAIAIDSRSWAGGQLVFGALDASYKFATFSGSALAATLQTCTVSGPTSKLVTWVTPKSDAASTMAVGYSNALTDALTFNAAGSKKADGRVEARARGKNIAFKETIPAATTWTYALGVDDIVAPKGGPK